MEKRHFNQVYCNNKCRDRVHYLNCRLKKLKKYHENRIQILQKQTKRWSERYKNDNKFREKRRIRDKTIRLVNLRDKKCIKCGRTNDLHRHHPHINDYQSFDILCRHCHNTLHFGSPITPAHFI